MATFGDAFGDAFGATLGWSLRHSSNLLHFLPGRNTVTL